MKFMMNGALTLGTFDGANLEIVDQVGEENCFMFGPKIDDFPATMSYYNSQWQYQNVQGLKRVVDALIDGTISDNRTGMFQDIYDSLLTGSQWQAGDPLSLIHICNRVKDICRVLYPNDSSYDGKVLRLRQQYFFVSASLQYVLDSFKRIHGNDFSQFPNFNCIQLNDTHPVLAIPELMRLLIDENRQDVYKRQPGNAAIIF